MASLPPAPTKLDVEALDEEDPSEAEATATKTMTKNDDPRERVLNLLLLHLAATDKNNKSINQLNEAVTDWGTGFNQNNNKIVLMVDHIERKFGGGNVKALVQLLKQATKNALDLAWARGTVNYRVYGYGCGRYDDDYEWMDTEESKMTLSLQNYYKRIGEDDDDDTDYSDSDSDNESCYGSYEDDYAYEFDAYEDLDNGDVNFDADSEMIPSNFYDTKGYKERFKSTYHGLKAKRRYKLQNAIVIWPNSASWRVLTNDDIGTMCRFLLREGPDERRVGILSNLIVEDKSFAGYSGNKDRQLIVPSFMEVLVALGDPDVAVTFWKCYLTKRRDHVPEEILPQLGSFLKAFGSYNDVKVELLNSLSDEVLVRDPSSSILFFAKCAESVDLHGFCQLWMEKFVGLMDQLQVVVNAPAAKAFMEVFQSCMTGQTDRAKLLSAFLDGATRSSCVLKTSANYQPRSDYKQRGPIALCGSGLPKVCEALNWQGIGHSLVFAVQKLIEHGSLKEALALLRELAGPTPHADLDSATNGNHYSFCSKLLASAVNLLSQAAAKEPCVEDYLDLLLLAARFDASSINSLVNDILKHDHDTTIAPLSLALHEKTLSMKLPIFGSVVFKLAVSCVEVLTKRLSEPMESIINWSMDVKLETDMLRHPTINNFLRCPCQRSRSWEVAKHSHEKVLSALKPLCSTGYIKAYPYRPSGVRLWSIKIDKLYNKPNQSMNSIVGLECSCWRYDDQCSVKASKALMCKQKEDETTLKKLLKLPGFVDGKSKRKLVTQQDNSRDPKKSKASPVVIVID